MPLDIAESLEQDARELLNEFLKHANGICSCVCDCATEVECHDALFRLILAYGERCAVQGPRPVECESRWEIG